MITTQSMSVLGYKFHHNGNNFTAYRKLRGSSEIQIADISGKNCPLSEGEPCMVFVGNLSDKTDTHVKFFERFSPLEIESWLEDVAF